MVGGDEGEGEQRVHSLTEGEQSLFLAQILHPVLYSFGLKFFHDLPQILNRILLRIGLSVDCLNDLEHLRDLSESLLLVESVVSWGVN